MAGPIIELKRRAEANLAVHAGRSATGLWKRLTGPKHPGFKLAAVLTAAAAAFLARATGTFRVSADVTVEGRVQRAITAPFNGYIKEASLRAGDMVKAGQPIGRFEDRELQLEKIKLVAQREQLERQHREAMAKHERSQYCGARRPARPERGAARADRGAARARGDDRAGRRRATASGDLSQNLGSPVERGQVLFEVAPLDGFRIVLRVDERDMAHVSVGQRGELAVTAMPGEKACLFTVTSIVPVNLAQDGRNVFRVEARLDDEGARLRPGMTGVGKIHVEERRLVWIWTRSFTDWLRLKLWSWLP